jgi:hypothetical protein
LNWESSERGIIDRFLENESTDFLELWHTILDRVSGSVLTDRRSFEPGNRRFWWYLKKIQDTLHLNAFQREERSSSRLKRATISQSDIHEEISHTNKQDSDIEISSGCLNGCETGHFSVRKDITGGSNRSQIEANISRSRPQSLDTMDFGLNPFFCNSVSVATDSK